MAKKKRLPSPTDLSLREQCVIDAYFANGFKKMEAMRAAGYAERTVARNSGVFWRRGRIVAAIAKRQQAERAKFRLDEERLKELAGMQALSGVTLAKFKKVRPDGSLYWDFTGATQEDLATITELVEEVYMEGRGPQQREVKRFKVKAVDPLNAINTLLRAMGAFQDKVKVEGELSLVEILQQRGRQASPEKADG